MLKKSKRVWKFLFGLFSLSIVLFMITVSFLFFTQLGTSWRVMMADSLITTQHRHWAAYLIGEQGLKERVAYYQQFFENMSTEKDLRIYGPSLNLDVDPSKIEQIHIEKIERKTFSGYLMSVYDPKKVRIVVPQKVGIGEKVSSMVKRTGAMAGVNAGGFADPNWKGNGFVPIGLVMSGGKIYFNKADLNTKQHIVGIDQDGKMIAGKYSVKELNAMGVQEAVTFSPRFIINGKGLIKNQADGWGIAPRTAMAQTSDGTILFLVIDGRQKHSVGASLYDLQEILLEKGAVIAANLDGGSSTVLVHDNQILNSPASPYGERLLPTAWLVFQEPKEINIKNIWEGLDIEKIDPSKW